MADISDQATVPVTATASMVCGRVRETPVRVAFRSLRVTLVDVAPSPVDAARVRVRESASMVRVLSLDPMTWGRTRPSTEIVASSDRPGRAERITASIRERA
jgi:hypothetical protein